MAKETVKKRSYKAEMAPARSISVDSVVEGVLQSAKLTEITDKLTKKEKEVWVYTFRDSKGKPFAIFGAAQLDQTFEQVFSAEGGIDHCIGLHFKITRGADSKLSGNRTMGNYEIEVSEAS